MAPIADDDRVSTTAGESVTFDVLSNDSDPDGDPLFVTPPTLDPTVGELIEATEGMLTFIPSDTFDTLAFGESVAISFDYMLTDGELEDTATVTITINSSADPETGDLPLIIGTEFRDRLVGGDEAERIEGLADNDKIFAGGGDDFIIAGQGLDYEIFGEGGSDIFVFSKDDVLGVIRDFEDGADRIMFTGGIQFEDLTITQNAALNRFTIEGPDGYNSKVVAIYDDPATTLTEDDFIFL